MATKTEKLKQTKAQTLVGLIKQLLVNGTRSPIMYADRDILMNHSNRNAKDYNYLTVKVWTDHMILQRRNAKASWGKGPCRWESDSAKAKLRVYGCMPSRSWRRTPIAAPE